MPGGMPPCGTRGAVIPAIQVSRCRTSFRAGEGAFLIRAGYDFPWVEGLSAYALGVFGTAPDQAGQFRQNEYDFNLQFAPKKGCLKDLSLRLRYALVHQFGGDVDNLTDFRVICNYMIKF